MKPEWLGLTDREAHLLLVANNGSVSHRIGDNLIEPADAISVLAANITAAADSATG